MEMTEGALSPEIFRRWSGIAALAGALERRVWIETGTSSRGTARQTFPNLYTLLVAPPGVGKFVIEEVRDLWREVVDGNRPLLHIAPDNMSKASLMDSLAAAGQSKLPPEGAPIEYHSLLIAAEEFAVLLPGYDLEYIGTLNAIWNNKSLYTETRRTSIVKSLTINNPQLNILAGTQPGWLASVFPEEAWSTGLTRRMVMVYCAESEIKDIFADYPDTTAARSRVINALGVAASLHGAIVWSPEAFPMVQKWHLAGGPPAPHHTKLQHYNRSRTQLLLKLITISAVSRGDHDLIARGIDVERAMEWLLEVEKGMPDIFRAMIGKSDNQVIEEMYHYAVSVWRVNRQEGVPERALITFLRERVPSEKIRHLMDTAERSGAIARVSGTQDMYVPRAGGFVE